MKTTIQTCTLAASLLLCASFSKIQAQNTDTKPTAYHQKDAIGENPTADADIQTVSDFTNALASGDLDKVKTLLAANYVGHGPGPMDSGNVEQTIQTWQENYKTQSNRKVEFVTESFRVLAGDFQGNWVSVWGNYSCTINSIDLKIPFQTTAHVTNGKIDYLTTYYDQLYVYKTLGFTLTPPENSK